MAPMMGLGSSIATAVSERTAVVIEDYMFDASVAGELTPEVSPSDFHDTWDLDGTDFTPEASPDDEGYWDDFSDIITNGTFAADSDWTLANGASISGGQLTLPANSANISATQNIGDQTGNTLELTYTVVSSNISGGNFRVGGLAGGSVAPSATNLTSSVGTHTVFIEVPTSGSNNTLDLHLTTSVTSGSLVLDNVSVTEYAITPLDV